MNPTCAGALKSNLYGPGLSVFLSRWMIFSGLASFLPIKTGHHKIAPKVALKQRLSILLQIIQQLLILMLTLKGHKKHNIK